MRMRTQTQSHILYYTTLLVIVQLHVSSFVFSLQPPFACDPSNQATRSLPLCDKSLPIDRRADDLVSRLNLDEKIDQLIDKATAISRLGIPSYQWWSEALHAVSNWGHGQQFWTPGSTIHAATCFPQVITTAASFNPQTWYRIGQAIGDEARALYSNGQSDGLTFWAPNVNIFRDPRWGRGQETPGEDPLTAGKYAAAFVKGVQGDTFKGGSNAPLKTSACCKHLTAYDLDDWMGNARYTFNAKVTAQDMKDTFQPPFKMCVEDGHATCLMCSYNRVNGVPTCANYDLLTKTPRGSWGFDGYIASDCDSVALINGAHHYVRTDPEAVGVAFKAGLDVDCGDFAKLHGKAAVQQGILPEKEINRALKNLFSMRMRLGLFNGDPKAGPYGNIPPYVVCSQEHLNLALEAAQDGIVLLKNSERLLPLSESTVASLGVVGHNADNAVIFIGNYPPIPCKQISARQALNSYARNIKYVKGCDYANCTAPSIDAAVQIARSVDKVVMYMGLDQTLEHEGLDRVDLLLPGLQEKLITSVAAAAKTPIILVIFSGGPFDITFAVNNPMIGAILWAGYPGEAGGIAIANILFGKHNPSGKLPVTWYPQDFTKVPMTDMRMRADPRTGYPGRSYRFYNGRAIFKYGFGLSYSKFAYEFKHSDEMTIFLDKSLSLIQDTENSFAPSYDIESIGTEACKSMEFSTVVGVTNHGPMDGRHSVLLFSRWPTATNGRPMKQLVGFENLHLESGEQASVSFNLKPCEHLSRVHENGIKVLDAGYQYLMVGDEEYRINIMF